MALNEVVTDRPMSCSSSTLREVAYTYDSICSFCLSLSLDSYSASRNVSSPPPWAKKSKVLHHTVRYYADCYHVASFYVVSCIAMHYYVLLYFVPSYHITLFFLFNVTYTKLNKLRSTKASSILNGRIESVVVVIPHHAVSIAKVQCK